MARVAGIPSVWQAARASVMCEADRQFHEDHHFIRARLFTAA